MSPRRVQDPEGAKTVIIGFNTTSGAVAIVIKRMSLNTGYTEAETGRQRLDPALTTGQSAGSHSGAKKILVYDTHPHPLSSMDPMNCEPRTTPRDCNSWVINTMKVLEHFIAIPMPEAAEGNTVDMDTMEGLPPPPRLANVEANNTQQGWTASNKGKAPTARGNTQPRQSEADTSPERRAYNAPADPNRIKKRQYNRFQSHAEEHS